MKLASLAAIEEQQNNEDNTHNRVSPPPFQIRRRQPFRQRVDGVIPEQINFRPSLTTMTPSRHGNLIRNNMASDTVQAMVETCSGMPMQLYPAKSGRRCDACTKNTSWYCVGCKRWLCMSRRATTKTENSKDLKLYSHTVKSKVLQFNKACFHEAHEEAWLKFGERSSTTITP